jgi:D-alanyl-D-alanine carboxypeptidase
MNHLLVVTLLISTLSGCATKREAKSLTEKIKAIQTNSQMPGLQVQVWENGREILSFVNGVRAIEQQDIITASDKWHIGSCTKPMTAFLIGMLVDQKKLSWETPLKDILPKNYTLHPTLQMITVSHLLTHSSGLSDITAPEKGALWAKLFTDKPNMRERLVKGLLSLPAKFTPGSSEEYSNSGYVILGWIVEQVTKKSWEEVMKRDLFQKLSMKSCGFGAPKNAPLGHSVTNGKITSVAAGLQADNPPALGPAGTVHCSALDWSKFLAHYLNGQQTLLSASTLEKLKTNVNEKSYFTYSSIARLERDWSKGPVFAMAGSNTLNYAYVAIAPALGRIYTVNTNSGTDKVSAGATEILIELTKL